jgi:hypothetical protein
MAEYERAANGHDLERILPLIADDATYWFTDGSYRGRKEIAGALERTFAAIHDEAYEISELEWVALTEELAGLPSSARGAPVMTPMWRPRAADRRTERAKPRDRSENPEFDFPAISSQRLPKPGRPNNCGDD